MGPNAAKVVANALGLPANERAEVVEALIRSLLYRPPEEQHLHLGARFGRAALASIFDEPATKGRYLDALREDREGER